jgi:hypothetical protein
MEGISFFHYPLRELYRLWVDSNFFYVGEGSKDRPLKQAFIHIMRCKRRKSPMSLESAGLLTSVRDFYTPPSCFLEHPNWCAQYATLHIKIG